MGNGCRDHNGHNDFAVREYCRAGIFLLVSGFEAIYISFCAALHTYVHYPRAEKREHTEVLCVEEVANPAYSALLGSGYQHHRGCVQCGSHSLRYQTYLIASSCHLKYPVALAYGELVAVLKMLVTDLWERTELVVGGSSGDNKNDKYYKAESSNDGSGGESTNSAEAPCLENCCSLRTPGFVYC